METHKTEIVACKNYACTDKCAQVTHYDNPPIHCVCAHEITDQEPLTYINPPDNTGPSFGGGGGTQGGGGDDIRFAKKPDFLSDKSLKSEYSKADEEADPIQGSSIDELFSSSEHPPTLLPLDYQLHTKARVVVPKQVKVVKDEPMDYSDAAEVESMDTESSLPAKAVLAPPTKVEVHQTKISDLFTPQDVSKLSKLSELVHCQFLYHTVITNQLRTLIFIHSRTLIGTSHVITLYIYPHVLTAGKGAVPVPPVARLSTH